jgi:hypothetical protein
MKSAKSALRRVLLIMACLSPSVPAMAGAAVPAEATGFSA